MTAIKHILWDWNGTLFDDTALWVELVNETLAARNMPEITPEVYRDKIAFPLQRFYEAIGFDFSDEPFAPLAVDFMARYEPRRMEATPHADVPETLAAVTASGRTQSILSAYEQSRLRTLVEACGLTEHFTAVCGIETIEAGSKVERALAWAEENWPEDRPQILMVGDTLHDKEVADALGCPCALVANGYQAEAKLRRAGVPVLGSASGVLALLG